MTKMRGGGTPLNVGSAGGSGVTGVTATTAPSAAASAVSTAPASLPPAWAGYLAAAAFLIVIWLLAKLWRPGASPADKWIGVMVLGLAVLWFTSGNSRPLLEEGWTSATAALQRVTQGGTG